MTVKWSVTGAGDTGGRGGSAHSDEKPPTRILGQVTKTAAPARILARYKVLLGGGPGLVEGGGALGRFESPLHPPSHTPNTQQGFLYGHLEPARRLINKT